MASAPSLSKVAKPALPEEERWSARSWPRRSPPPRPRSPRTVTDSAGDQAFAVDARVLLTRDGGIFRHGAPEDALTDETLGAVYGVPVTLEKTASGPRVCLPSLAPQSTPTMTSEALTTA